MPQEIIFLILQCSRPKCGSSSQVHVTDVFLCVILLAVKALSTIQEHVGATTRSFKGTGVRTVTRYAGENEHQVRKPETGGSNSNVANLSLLFDGISGSLWRSFSIYLINWFSPRSQFWLHGPIIAKPI